MNAMAMMHEQKAQSGAVFRLMVDAIIGLVILLMIISSINYFNSLRLEVSKAEFTALIKSAVDSPNGKIVESGNLVFSAGDIYDSVTISFMTGYPKDCFRFQTNLAFTETGSGRYIKFGQPVDAKVYASCRATGEECSPDDEDCLAIDCLISFGKKLEADWS